MVEFESIEAEIAARFHALLLTDQLDGEKRGLPAYLEEFPSQHWEIVARVWIESEQRATTATEGALDQVSKAGEHAGDLAQYRIVRELGRGGQGTVYLATDTRLGRKTALKVLREAGMASDLAIMRLRREAEVTSRLNHPGICTVFETGMVGDTPFIAMQYLEGETLSSRIAAAKEDLGRDSAQRREDAMQVALLIEQSARALHAAHEQGVLHRDIKPANIMATLTGQPVIMDFGLARAEDSEQVTLTRSGDVFGTPAYMPPEQLSREAMALDRRSDIYSLGVSLFECLCLQTPFEGPTREALYKSILTREPPNVCRLNPAIPQDLRVVVETALEKDRNRRYQTAEDFAEDLRRVRQREPILARPATILVKFTRWAQRNPWVAASVLAAFLSLMIGLSLSLFFLKKAVDAGEAKSEALNQFVQMSDTRMLENLKEWARSLWPQRSSMIADMDAWLLDARELSRRLPLHRKAMSDLQAGALAFTADDRVRDDEMRRVTHAEFFRSLDVNRGRLAGLEQKLASEALDPVRRDKLNDERERLSKVITEQERDPRMTERRLWRFQSDVDAWRHYVLQGFLGEMESLGQLIAEVDRRRSNAQIMESRTTSSEGPWEAWLSCTSDISRKGGVYGGLGIRPQVGLIPLGKDRDSGLWEFWAVESGTRPSWNGPVMSGRASMSPEAGIVMVLLPGGTFWMGAQLTDPKKRNYDRLAFKLIEEPVHPVTLDPFFISKYEVTQAQWSRIVPERPRPSGYATGFSSAGITITNLHPVETVNYEDCTDALRRVGLSLPTEAQWEYAARAGTHTSWWPGDAVEALDGKANVADAGASAKGVLWRCMPILDDGYHLHSPVGIYGANAFGLHDVIGNVWEWCRGRYSAYHWPPNEGDGLRDSGAWGSHTRADDATAFPTLNLRVARGGSYHSIAIYLRSAVRLHRASEERSNLIGCRPARAVE